MVIVEEQRELTVEWNQPERSNGIIRNYRVDLYMDITYLWNPSREDGSGGGKSGD